MPRAAGVAAALCTLLLVLHISNALGRRRAADDEWQKPGYCGWLGGPHEVSCLVAVCAAAASWCSGCILADRVPSAPSLGAGHLDCPRFTVLQKSWDFQHRQYEAGGSRGGRWDEGSWLAPCLPRRHAARDRAARPACAPPCECPCPPAANVSATRFGQAVKEAVPVRRRRLALRCQRLHLCLSGHTGHPTCAIPAPNPPLTYPLASSSLTTCTAPTTSRCACARQCP